MQSLLTFSFIKINLIKIAFSKNEIYRYTLTGEFPRIGPRTDWKKVTMDGTVKSNTSLSETCVCADCPEYCCRNKHYDRHDQTYRSQQSSVFRLWVELAFRVVVATSSYPAIRYHCVKKFYFIGTIDTIAQYILHAAIVAGNRIY